MSILMWGMTRNRECKEKHRIDSFSASMMASYLLLLEVLVRMFSIYLITHCVSDKALRALIGKWLIVVCITMGMKLYNVCENCVNLPKHTPKSAIVVQNTAGFNHYPQPSEVGFMKKTAVQYVEQGRWRTLHKQIWPQPMVRIQTHTLCSHHKLYVVQLLICIFHANRLNILFQHMLTTLITPQTLYTYIAMTMYNTSYWL